MHRCVVCLEEEGENVNFAKLDRCQHTNCCVRCVENLKARYFSRAFGERLACPVCRQPFDGYEVGLGEEGVGRSNFVFDENYDPKRSKCYIPNPERVDLPSAYYSSDSMSEGGEDYDDFWWGLGYAHPYAHAHAHAHGEDVKESEEESGEEEESSPRRNSEFIGPRQARSLEDDYFDGHVTRRGEVYYNGRT